MADTQIGPMPEIDVVDKRKTIGGSANPFGATFKTAVNDIASLRSALTTVSAGKYPTSYLNTISVNDMVFALRTELESAGM